MLRDEYRIRQVTRLTANSIAELADKLDGMHAANLIATVNKFNNAVQMHVPFDPTPGSPSNTPNMWGPA